jgi:hypothetical protein
MASTSSFWPLPIDWLTGVPSCFFSGTAALPSADMSTNRNWSRAVPTHENSSLLLAMSTARPSMSSACCRPSWNQ